MEHIIPINIGIQRKARVKAEVSVYVLSFTEVPIYTEDIEEDTELSDLEETLIERAYTLEDEEWEEVERTYDTDTAPIIDWAYTYNETTDYMAKEPLECPNLDPEEPDVILYSEESFRKLMRTLELKPGEKK